MNNYKYLIIFVQKIENFTANSIFHQLRYDDVISDDDVTQLLSKDVFIIEEQLCKSIWQLVEG